MKRVQQRVGLTQARFFAFHGFYPEEQLLGTAFFVDIDVVFERDLQMPGEEDIGNTVNYADLYSIAKEEMDHPRKLLETVAEAMLLQVRNRFPQLAQIHVRITKEHPPFGGDIAKSYVALAWSR